MVLRGGYTERFYPNPDGGLFGVLNFRYNHWKRWSVHKMTRDTAHRIVGLLPGTKSLIFVGKRNNTWGFYTRQGWRSWQEYEEAKG